MAIGNDIVDLQLPDNRKHERVHAYARKCCAGPERSWLLSQPDPLGAFWWLWTLKEAAYKAVRQLGYPAFQAASRLVVEIANPFESARIQYAGMVLHGTSEATEDYIHSIVVSDVEVGYRYCLVPSANSSTCVPSGYSVSQGATGFPVLLSAETNAQLACSKSHDGKWQSLAWSIG